MKASRPPQPTAASVATQNACTVCMPLGACLAYRGIEGAMPFLHGPQGCATYIRRFLIGHFREPMDIACSGFHEESAIFGGRRDLHRGLDNVAKQYEPRMIGIATTCLAETIGDDVPGLLHVYEAERVGTPSLARASTPSYQGTHADGYHAAVHAVVSQVACKAPPAEPSETPHLNLFPNMLSPADLRYLNEFVADHGMGCTLLPDYSETLDRPVLAEYERIPAGGTPLEAIRAMSGAKASIQLGRAVPSQYDAAEALHAACGVPARRLGIPIGIRETDAFVDALKDLGGHGAPKHEQERGRLTDAYVDGHKYCFGKRVAIVGEADLVIGLASFAAETGAVPALCATGGRSGGFGSSLAETLDTPPDTVAEGVDFSDIERLLGDADVDLILGTSRCAPMARRLDVPLVRVGMPIHDRIGAQRLLHVGYRGTQALFDALVNTLIAREQDGGDAGFVTM